MIKEYLQMKKDGRKENVEKPVKTVGSQVEHE